MRYLDATFTSMMYAKVVTVQLINYMGYDCLFQDVDMHWYKNPLEAFHNKTSPLYDFDILFQDDGARSLRYAPYCANSGFYFVRYNDRTRYLFVSLLLHSDMIVAHGSHQQVLVSLLTEHASLTGLKVKVLGHDGYPGGWDYHRHSRWEYLRKLPSGETIGEIFHMSWTENKDNKILFMKQMGMWYLNEDCNSKKLDEILSLRGGTEITRRLQEETGDLGDVTDQAAVVNAEFSVVNKMDVFNMCCSVEPLISCHYRDKPSVIDCSSSPPIDKGGVTFWK